MWQANVWDWLATSLTIVGFSILLCLGAYLALCLIAGTGGHSPEDAFDSGPMPEDAHELTWLAS